MLGQTESVSRYIGELLRKERETGKEGQERKGSKRGRNWVLNEVMEDNLFNF